MWDKTPPEETEAQEGQETLPTEAEAQEGGLRILRDPRESQVIREIRAVMLLRLVLTYPAELAVMVAVQALEAAEVIREIRVQTPWG
jgi:hypothetical protein